jgi:hypothetical protein
MVGSISSPHIAAPKKSFCQKAKTFAKENKVVTGVAAAAAGVCAYQAYEGLKDGKTGLTRWG